MQPQTQDQNTLQNEESTRTVVILVNTKPVSVPAEVTGAQIKLAAKVPADFVLFRVEGHKEISVADDEIVRVHHHEKFIASPTLDPAFVAASSAHAIGVETVRDAFAGHLVDVHEPGDGTTVVTVRDIEIGGDWNVGQLDLTVKLQVTFPSSPPYPFYGPPGMARTDGRSLSQIQPQSEFDGQARTQISLAKPFDPTIETLGARLVSVVSWLRHPR